MLSRPPPRDQELQPSSKAIRKPLTVPLATDPANEKLRFEVNKVGCTIRHRILDLIRQLRHAEAWYAVELLTVRITQY
jgi:hypothetical protein